MATIKGFIHQSVEGYFSGALMHSSANDMTSCGYVLVGPCDIEYEIPAGFNPIAAEVEGLQKVLDKENEKHASKVRNIKDRIASLLCLTFDPVESVAPEDDEPGICTGCNGSGEGAYGFSTCISCKGSGSEK